MAKIQTRKSVSIRKGTYELMTQVAKHRGIPMSQLLEQIINDGLGVTAAGDKIIADAKQALSIPVQ